MSSVRRPTSPTAPVVSDAGPHLRLLDTPAISQARFLVVGLPGFRLERCGWSAEDRVGLVAEVQGAPRLLVVSPAASAEGLRSGMTAAEARALCPSVALEPLQVEAEAADLADLTTALTAFSDHVEPLGPELIALDVRSTARLHGGEAGLMAAVRHQLQAFGHRLHLAVADHPQAAAAWVRHQRPDRALPPRQTASWLAPLPIATLAPAEALHDQLRAVGIDTIGAFAALDPASVSGRYGAEGVALHRVARGEPAVGWTATVPEDAPERIVVLLDAPLTTTAPLLAHVERGLVRLRDQLEARDLALAAFDLRLELDHGSPVRLPVHLGHPSRDPAVLLPLVARRLERLSLESPVVGLALDPREVVPGIGWQEDLLDRRQATEPLPELLARLLDVLGEDAVFYAEPVDTWRPEASWRPRHPLRWRPAPPAVVDDPVAHQEAPDWSTPRPRPTLLRSVPQPIALVEDEHGRPLAVRTARGLRPLHRVEGPELLAGDWWHADGGFDRAYWVAHVGRTVWLFRERSQWFVHGWFD